MNSSPADAQQQGEPPNKKPQIGRREIGALLLLPAINWTFVLLYSRAARRRVAIPCSPTFLAQVQAGNVTAGLAPAAANAPTAEPATLVAS